VNSLVLRVAVAYLLPLLLAFALFLLLRGHDAPGGGFAAGLIAASAAIFYTIAFSARDTRRVFRLPLEMLIGTGLLMMSTAGLWGLVAEDVLLAGQWTTFTLPALGQVSLGTPLLFDLGVCLTVTGAIATIVVALDEE